MKVRVKLFAAAKDRLGRDSVEVDLPDAATAQQLRGALVEQFPPLADVMAHARLAVDSEYAVDGMLIPRAAEVAMIPPVSGG
jgi:molybdopterin converting factor subunit 1